MLVIRRVGASADSAAAARHAVRLGLIGGDSGGLDASEMVTSRLTTSISASGTDESGAPPEIGGKAPIGVSADARAGVRVRSG